MMKQVADSEMVKNATGDDYDALQEPPLLKADRYHALWEAVRAGLMGVYDPEIPTNIYELGLILEVRLEDDAQAGVTDCHVTMTLTSPGCPVAQEMPEMVRAAILPIDGIGEVTVDIIWEPAWTPAMMSETAKMELNMF